MDNTPAREILGWNRLSGFQFCAIAGAILSIYFLTGSIAYSVIFQQWSLVDSIYFCMATLFTVGYGDLVPSQAVSKGFTIAFLLFGMAIDTVVIGLIGAFIFAQYSNNLQEDCIEESISDIETIKRAREELGMSKYTEDLDESLDKLLRDRMMKTNHMTNKRKLRERRATFLWVTVAATAVVITIGIAYYERWRTADAIYFLIVTALTIGYGDIAPFTTSGRILTIILIPITYALVARIVSEIAKSLLQKTLNRQRERLVTQTIPSIQTLYEIGDRECRLSKLSYLEWSLVQSGLVSKAEIDAILARFESLDYSKTGYIEIKDVSEETENICQRRNSIVRLGSVLDEDTASGGHVWFDGSYDDLTSLGLR